MARDFTKNLANYMSLGINAINPLLSGAGAISIHAWINPDTYTTGASDNRIFAVNFSTVLGSAIIVCIDGSAANKRLSIFARSQNEAMSNRIGLLDITTGAWHKVGCVINIAGDTITPYLDGVADNGGAAAFGAAVYTPGVPTTVADVIGGNAAPPGGTNFQFDGRIAEVALWNIDIGAEGFAQLADGFSPVFVRPEGLRVYMPLWSGVAAGPERDIRSGRSGLITGTVARADNPSILRYKRAEVSRMNNPPTLDVVASWFPRWM